MASICLEERAVPNFEMFCNIILSLLVLLISEQLTTVAISVGSCKKYHVPSSNWFFTSSK